MGRKLMLIHTLLRGASRRRRLCEDSSPRLLTWRQPFFYSTSREADPEVALIKQASIPFSSPWLIPKLNFQRKLVSMKASLNERHNLRYAMFTTQSKAEPTGGIIEVPLAQTGEGIADCELLSWFVQEGDEIEEFQPLCSVQSDKATIQITSRYNGKVSRLNFIPGDIIKVGESLLELISGAHTAPNEESSKSKVLATPAVRQLARTYGVKLEDVLGSGEDGRILNDDVMKYVESKEGLNEELEVFSKILPKAEVPGDDEYSQHLTTQREVHRDPQPVNNDYGDKEINVRGYQRVMVKTMTAAAAIPHFYLVEELNLNALVKLRNNLKETFTGQGLKLTFLPFMIKALSAALVKYPLVNSTFNENASQILCRGSHNVGVAIASSHGLVVPNIKNVQCLSVLEIVKELSRLTGLATANQLSSEDVSGGTITVSNIGSIGGKLGFPLVNLPEAAIVAFGRVYKAPCFSDDNKIYAASLMNVTWAADHRVLDGATLVNFCNEWKSLVEQPERLLLHLK